MLSVIGDFHGLFRGRVNPILATIVCGCMPREVLKREISGLINFGRGVLGSHFFVVTKGGWICNFRSVFSLLSGFSFLRVGLCVLWL